MEIATRATQATLCLTTALARHGLTDIIPARIDVALPRDRHPPRTRAPVRWHAFASQKFTVGREELAVTNTLRTGNYTAQRCLVDAFRLRHREGPDLAYEALRRWLQRRGSQPVQLLAMAGAFPKAEPALRAALQVLL